MAIFWELKQIFCLYSVKPPAVHNFKHNTTVLRLTLADIYIILIILDFRQSNIKYIYGSIEAFHFIFDHSFLNLHECKTSFNRELII